MELSRRWCPRLARFSFYTRELAGGYLDAADNANNAGSDEAQHHPAALGPGDEARLHRRRVAAAAGEFLLRILCVQK